MVIVNRAVTVRRLLTDSDTGNATCLNRLVKR